MKSPRAETLRRRIRILTWLLRDPVRNIWLFRSGMIACVLVVPYAFVCGALRGIPIYWRLIDCSFGVFGFIPLWFCHRWAAEVAEEHSSNATPTPPATPERSPKPHECNC